MSSDCPTSRFLPNKFKHYLVAIATITLGIGNSPTVAQAQITPDTSLGDESSVVTPNVEVKGETADRIDGGAIRDRNLFHSFDEFNVDAGQRVYFANPANIEQIFTRVTGNNPSNINGTLGVDGAADLLLLNPNGIIFGENSSLDLEGSFFGTSADSLLFEDDAEFSAVQPSSSLLTISVPVGLQMGNNPGSISVRSPLEVGSGQNFSLVGGEINLTGSSTNADENGLNVTAGITARGGKIELGGLSTTGIVNIEDSNTLRFSEELPRANIALNNFLLNTLGSGNGSIKLYSQNLQLTDSTIQTGIDFRVESTQAQAGDITIDTIDTTVIESSNDGTSQIINTTGDLSELSEIIDDAEVVNVAGNAGNISINTGSLLAEGFYIIGSSTQGEGNAGNVIINAQESVSLAQPELSRFSSIFSTSGDLASGNGADIIIEANSFSLSNVALRTDSSGAGNAGNIQLNVADSISLSNNSQLGTNSTGQGNAGNLNIITDTLNVRDSIVTGISALTDSSGQAGNLNITASESINIEGEFTDSSGEILTSGIASITGSNGDAGEININTDSLTLAEGARIDASTISAGNGGNINIDAESINIQGSSDTGVLSSITASSGGSGRGGNINITSSNLTIRDGVGAIVTQAEQTGDAGNINISTEQLIVENNIITTGSISTGQAGNLDINASTITLNGTATDEIPAGLSSTGIDRGKAGNLSVNTGQLTIMNGAQIQSATGGMGDGGNVSIEAEEIKLIGSSDSNLASAISAFTTDSGKGGIINITTNNLEIADDAIISVRSVGGGNAGSIFASIDGSLKLDNGTISSRSDRSSGGEIEITAGDIRLRGDSNIQTSVGNGAGGGGNIILSADSIVAFDDSDIFAFAADGVGGNITLDTDAFFATNYNPAALNANPQLLENNSRVDINASGSVFGIVDVPDVNFLPNSLVELSEDTINADEVVANSCVVRNETGGTFIVTGSDGLRSRPGDAAAVDYATGAVRSIPDRQPQANTEDSWQPGDPIVEPDKVYRLSNGKLVLSRGCS